MPSHPPSPARTRKSGPLIPDAAGPCRDFGVARRAFAENVHPRLLFGPENVSYLRRQARSGLPGRILKEILRRCQRCTDPRSPQFVDPSGGRKKLLDGVSVEDAGEALHCLGFAYVLTGDRAYAEQAAARMLAMTRPEMEGPSWPITATLEGHLPVCFDLVHDALSEPERRTIQRFLRRWVVEAYEAETLAHPMRYVWGLGVNPFLHVFEKYVLSLAATFEFPGDWSSLERVADLARRSLHLGWDEGGAIYEGPSYGWMDSQWISMVAEILARAGIADFWSEEPRFGQMCRHWVYLVLPGRRGQNTIGDAWRFAGGRPHLALLHHAWRLNDPAIGWAWERMGGRGRIPGLGVVPALWTTQLGRVLLWESQRAVSAPPDRAGYAPARCSGGAGQVVLRSGWGDEDVYLGILAAGRTPGSGIHQHVDAGHFTLLALNESFSIDSGYGDIAGRYHSVILPEGKEPPMAPQGFDNMFFGGRVARFASDAAADFVRLDVGEAWHCRWAFRDALLVKSPRVPPYVILVDDINLRAELADYLWLMNSEPGNRIELDEARARATVHGRRHRLEVVWSFPAAEDYPTPHQLTLACDEMDSFPLQHRKVDVNYFLGKNGADRPEGGGRWGAGLRPRLQATLHGYNGQLLSVLLPRRRGQAQIAARRVTAHAHFGIVLEFGRVTDTILVSPIDHGLNLEGITGEASVAVVRRDRRGRVVWWAAAEAYALAAGGKTLLPRRGTPATLALPDEQVEAGLR